MFKILFICCLWFTMTLPAQAVTIAQIRQHPPCEAVTVSGVVTVPSGAFRSGTGDRGFAIQDETAGIYVTTSTDWQMQLGQTVEITGTIHDDGHGLLVLDPDTPQAAIHPLGNTPPIQPHRVPTGKVGETTEGEIVTVSGQVVAPLRHDPPYGVGILMDDGSGPVQVFINESTAIAIPERLPMGTKLEVQGFSGQYDQYIEISPRINADLIIITPPMYRQKQQDKLQGDL